MYVLATLPGSVHSIISQENLLLESIGWMAVENPMGVFTKCVAFGTLAKCKGYKGIMNVYSGFYRSTVDAKKPA